uniref:Uncharacterized protein n=1 Tax=Anguilla anguilla TaxID=7936 RepID=A0A0E9PG45_ANGAN
MYASLGYTQNLCYSEVWVFNTGRDFKLVNFLEYKQINTKIRRGKIMYSVTT